MGSTCCTVCTVCDVSAQDSKGGILKYIDEKNVTTRRKHRNKGKSGSCDHNSNGRVIKFADDDHGLQHKETSESQRKTAIKNANKNRKNLIKKGNYVHKEKTMKKLLQDPDSDFLIPEVEEVLEDLPEYDYFQNYKDLKGAYEFIDHSIFSDGSKYCGQLLSGTNLKEGLGYIILPEGSLIQGEFEAGEPIFGRFIQTTGDVYEGYLQNYKPNGEGKLSRGGEVVHKGKFSKGVYRDNKASKKKTSKSQKNKKKKQRRGSC
ncbi:unnamed protein product [Moneuplotes crassus]|uniref:Uncharacterized protein n=1 Tax=Euplotes crassus TaxID=5936 RepID=A0AAD1XLT8_EUPCR|nr:unnamed protein product [Moneuplotes crassus]